MASDTMEPSSPLSSLPDSSRASSPSSDLTSLASMSPPPELPPLPPSIRKNNIPYPSPVSSQQSSQTGSPAPDGMDSSSNTDREGPPPTKKRRISKERTTEYLDLRSGDVDPNQQAEMDRLLRVLHRSQKIVAIAGAGISVSAGIPDFRSSQGLFRSLKEEHKLKGSGKHLFDASVYKDDTSTSSFHDMVSSMSRLTRDAKPTAFHHMLATIASEDRLLRLYSQNVDGIDTSLDPLKTSAPLRKGEDGKWPRTVQLHGGLDKMVCSKCHELSDFDADLFSGPVPPLCQSCETINNIRTQDLGKRSHGIGRLRPRMVLYNEHNPDDVAIGSVTKDDLRKRPDAVIVAGTTLKVPGVRRIVREMCGVVRDRRGGVAIWINNDLPPVSKDLEDCFDIIVQGPCDEVATRAAMRKWDELAEEEEGVEINDEDARKASARTAEVHIPECTLTELDALPLPTTRHYNNSFKPVNVTPKKPSLPSPKDWSPLSSRRSSVYQSIERGDDNITVNSSGMMTPPKSQKSTPAKKLPSLTEKLKDAGKSKKPIGRPSKAAVSTTKSKTTNSKSGRPKKTTSGKPQAGSQLNALTNTFKQSKSNVIKLQTAVTKRLPPSPAKSPSKLRQVSSANEPMHTIPPQDARNNLSPSKAKPAFPNLFSENPSSQSVKKMSVSAIMN